MNNYELSILSYKDVHGDETTVSIIENYRKAEITDFALLLGGESNDTGTWWYWIDGTDASYSVVDSTGRFCNARLSRRSGGIRPCLKVPNLSRVPYEIIGTEPIKEVTFGEYPQFSARTLSPTLENEYQNGSLSESGKYYSSDSQEWTEEELPFKERRFTEYIYHNRKFIRVIGDENGINNHLSDGEAVYVGKPYWLEVTPVHWYLDEANQQLISRYILISGVRYNHNSCKYITESEIYHFLQDYMLGNIYNSSDISILGHNEDLRSFVYRKKMPKKIMLGDE